MSLYRYNPPTSGPAFGPLPPGDYSFVVAEADEPHLSGSGNLVLSLKLSIQPGGEPVYANPWARTPESVNQDGRDGIAEFLLCVNKAPKPGQEPDWKSLVGAKGKCRLTTEVAQQGALAGKEVNKVHYFHVPKQVAGTAAPQSFTKSEFEKARQAQAKASGITTDELDDLPY